jgi:hypothetical protein
MLHSPWTGELRKRLVQLKTKVHAVHAGLSQLLLLQKVCTQSRVNNFLIYLNNNLLIVLLVQAVAMEDL